MRCIGCCTIFSMAVYWCASSYRVPNRPRDIADMEDGPNKTIVNGRPAEEGAWPHMSDEEYANEMARRVEEGPLPRSRSINTSISSYPTCYLSQSDCALKDMRGTTLVYADNSKTKCWNGDDFFFVVRPGSADKLYYYFPGGGACFKTPGLVGILLPAMETCFNGMEIAWYALGLGNGAHNFSDATNVFSDYTLITSPYCDGGLHISNVSFNAGGTQYYQYGYEHNHAVVNWAKTNVPQVLNSFVMMGSSAGAIGAGIWADTLLSTFRYKKATAIFDSYLAIFGGDAQGKLVREMGVCDTPVVSRWRDDCRRGKVYMERILDHVIGKYPKVAFAHIQSKVDSIQIAFYSVVGFFFGGGIGISQDAFYYWSNYLMNVYNKHPNYITYIMNGDFHCPTIYPVEYLTSSTLGPNTTAPAGTPMLKEWITKLINRDGAQSECTGPRQDIEDSEGDYCYKNLFPKVLRT